jgi:hypothetical protein
VTRIPSPFAALTQLFAKAFTILGDRDGAGGRSAIIVGGSRSKTRRSSRAPASQAQEAATPNSSDPSAGSTETSGRLHQRRVTDSGSVSVRARESDLTTHATRKE